MYFTGSHELGFLIGNICVTFKKYETCVFRR